MGLPLRPIDQRTIGNARLDQVILERRPRLFLRRNLRDILDRHEQGLAGSTTQARESDDNHKLCKLHSAGEQLDIWNMLHPYFAKEHIDRVEKSLQHPRHQSYLIIERLIISSSEIAQNVKDQNYEDDLEWIHNGAKPDKTIIDPSVTCTATLQLGEESAVASEIPPAQTVSRQGQLCLVKDQLHIVFPGDTDAFSIPEPVEADVRGHRRYGFRITIKCSDAGLHAIAGIPPPPGAPSSRITTGLQEFSLGKIRRRVLERPMTLYIKQTGGISANIVPKMSALITRRRYPTSSPLSLFTQPLRELFGPRTTSIRERLDAQDAAQLPTPCQSDKDFDEVRLQITYHYLRNRRLIKDDLECPLCRQDYGFSSFTRLHLHFLTHHEHFAFDVSNDDDDSGNKIVAISIAGSLKPAVKMTTPELRINWLAPSTPFDQQAYIDGNSAWDISQVKAQKSGKSKRKEPPRYELLVARTKPGDVPNMVRQSRKLYRVPGLREQQDGGKRPVKFLRADSMREVHPGELISESDEDVEYDWQLQRQRQQSTRVKLFTTDDQQDQLSPNERDFVLDLNIHMMREHQRGIVGDKLGRHTWLRFARSHRHKLQLPDWRAQLEAKLQRLVKHQILDQADVDYCLEVTEEDTEPSFAEDEEDTAAQPRRDSCICGKLVDEIRGVIYCHGEDCAIRAHHMSCVGLQIRPPEWRCSKCLMASDTTE